jgi:glycopeptide antibiotics resistance protein
MGIKFMQKAMTNLRTVRKKKWPHWAAWTILTGYSIFMIYLLFFGFSRANRSGRMYNLVPFKTISNYISAFHHYNFDTWAVNLFGNVAAFIPFGLLVPLLFSRYSRPLRLIALFFMILLLMESVQFMTQTGSFDVDDILLNMVGVMIGFGLYAGLKRKRAVRGVSVKGNNVI